MARGFVFSACMPSRGSVKVEMRIDTVLGCVRLSFTASLLYTYLSPLRLPWVSFPVIVALVSARIAYAVVSWSLSISYLIVHSHRLSCAAVPASWRPPLSLKNCHIAYIYVRSLRLFLCYCGRCRDEYLLPTEQESGAPGASRTSRRCPASHLVRTV